MNRAKSKHSGDSTMLASRAVLLSLSAAWISLVVWKVLTFLPEPTGSQIRFETDFRGPYLTFCASRDPEFRAANKVRWSDSRDAQMEYVGNDTLLDFFRREGFRLADVMLDDVESCTTEHGHWTTSIDYRKGELCHTLRTEELNWDLSEIFLNKIIAFKMHQQSWGCRVTSENFHECIEKMKVFYTLYVHRLREDFWGADELHFTSRSDVSLASKSLPFNGTSSLEVSVEREIMSNMRRRPCVEDPTYSRAACWRQCFFDSLNCSMVESLEHEDNRPPCRAADWFWYKYEYRSFTLPIEPYKGMASGYLQRKNISYPCQCPQPCLLDRYTISSVEREHTLSSDTLKIIHLSIRPMLRVIETSVTYGSVDLLSDIGGFLGLLLGYSILSAFHGIKTFLSQVLRKGKASKASDTLEGVRVDQEQCSNNPGNEADIGLHVTRLSAGSLEQDFGV